MIDVAICGSADGRRFQLSHRQRQQSGRWAAAPAAQQHQRVRNGAGVGGSDRITLIWPDGAIKNTWLQVVVAAGGAIGLSAADTFYCGNAVGESGRLPGGCP